MRGFTTINELCKNFKIYTSLSLGSFEYGYISINILQTFMNLSSLTPFNIGVTDTSIDVRTREVTTNHHEKLRTKRKYTSQNRSDICV